VSSRRCIKSCAPVIVTPTLAAGRSRNNLDRRPGPAPRAPIPPQPVRMRLPRAWAACREPIHAPHWAAQDLAHRRSFTGGSGPAKRARSLVPACNRRGSPLAGARSVGHASADELAPSRAVGGL